MAEDNTTVAKAHRETRPETDASRFRTKAISVVHDELRGDPLWTRESVGQLLDIAVNKGVLQLVGAPRRATPIEAILALAGAEIPLRIGDDPEPAGTLIITQHGAQVLLGRMERKECLVMKPGGG